MSENINPIIELQAGNPVTGEAKCMVGCSHCPAKLLSSEFVDNQNLAHSPESIRCFNALTAYFGAKDQLLRVLIVGAPLLQEDSIIPLDLDENLGSLSFNLRQFVPGNTDDDIKKHSVDTVRKLMKLIPNLSDKKMYSLGIAVTPKLDEYACFMDMDKILIGLRAAINELLKNGVRYFNVLDVKVGVNRITEGQYDALTHMYDLPVAQLVAVVRNIVKEVCDQTIDVEEVKIETIKQYEDRVLMAVRHVMPNGFRFTASSRLIRHTVYPTSLDAIRSTCAITLYPDHVWINHSTQNVKDKSLRIPYEDFFEILEKATREGIDIFHLIADYVESKRVIA